MVAYIVMLIGILTDCLGSRTASEVGQEQPLIASHESAIIRDATATGYSFMLATIAFGLSSESSKVVPDALHTFTFASGSTHGVRNATFASA